MSDFGSDPGAHVDPRWVSPTLEVSSYIGGGVTSRVYQGIDHAAQREVAIKIVRADVDARTRARLERELAALTAVRHPGVVAVYGQGALPDGRPYLVMERIRGKPLHDVLAASPERRLPHRRAVALAIDLAEALASLHEAGVVHRDVKPANVIVSDDRGPVLVDLGFARLSDGGPRLTPDGRVVGTPGFIPPEVLFGVEAGPSADVYALGVLLFQMIAGKPPFEGELSKMIVAIMRGPRPDLRTHDPEISPALAVLVSRALSREAAARPRATELADDLRALASAE
jgi:serine/threonine-protein kinase